MTSRWSLLCRWNNFIQEIQQLHFINNAVGRIFICTLFFCLHLTHQIRHVRLVPVGGTPKLLAHDFSSFTVRFYFLFLLIDVRGDLSSSQLWIQWIPILDFSRFKIQHVKLKCRLKFKQWRNFLKLQFDTSLYIHCFAAQYGFFFMVSCMNVCSCYNVTTIMHGVTVLPLYSMLLQCYHYIACCYTYYSIDTQ